MPVFVEAEVGGIQKFIFNTGKLKEMIGGSEIIHYICTKDFFEPILREIGCSRAVQEEQPGDDWHMLIQNNAGILALLLPDEAKGRAFLLAFSRKALEDFPALTLYGACVPMQGWDMSAMLKARDLASEKIDRQRMAESRPASMPMLPVLIASPLDGLPAVDMIYEGGEREYVSLNSLCRRSPRMLQIAENRLRKDIEIPDSAEWTNDMERIFPHGGKMALIHMDGNDMGKLFGAEREKHKQGSLAENVLAMRALSDAIEDINIRAFSFAVRKIIGYLLAYDKAAIQQGRLILPLRPLVMGGDDITMIIRADLALAFIDLFVRRYEELARARKLELSLGVGMLVMNSSWPFARAFSLTEELCKSAKRITMDKDSGRPSSLDYLILTEDVENDVSALRKRVFTALDGARLTGKPFLIEGKSLSQFMREGNDILNTLPQSALRPALAACRGGEKAGEKYWLNLRENLERRLGGRKGQLMSLNRFTHLFPDNFFRREKDQPAYTLLGDYLELKRLMPQNAEALAGLFEIMEAEDSENV